MGRERLTAMISVALELSAKTKYWFIHIPNGFMPSVLAPNGVRKGDKPAVDVAGDFPLCINAGLFNPHPYTYEPEGILIANGKVIQNRPAVFYHDSMPLTIDKGGKLWYAEADADAYDLVSKGIVSAVCGFMPIVIDGKSVPHNRWTKVPHYQQPHQRQIIGQFENGDYGILTCEGRGYADSVGWTIEQAQKVCLIHGFQFAYNLDGGTSTETIVDGKLLTSVYERAADRFAPTFIVFDRVASL